MKSIFQNKETAYQFNATNRSGKLRCNGMVWSEYGQAWMTPESASYVEAECFCDDDFTSLYDWYQKALMQISDSISLTGSGVCTDEYFAEILKELGYFIVPCIDEDEDGFPVEWYEIFSTAEAEENFYNNCDSSVIAKF